MLKNAVLHLSWYGNVAVKTCIGGNSKKKKKKRERLLDDIIRLPLLLLTYQIKWPRYQSDYVMDLIVIGQAQALPSSLSVKLGLDWNIGEHSRDFCTRGM